MEIKKVLLLGSGALKIGQAGEFDYSGTQALKALRKEGIVSILINPNVATVQTSEGVADKCYFWPLTSEYIEKVIKIERPDGILLGFGGQTALNCGIELWERGVLQKYNVAVLGTPIEVILNTEDRGRFIERMKEINLKTVDGEVVSNIEEAKSTARKLRYPVIVRTAYALGGRGNGFARTDKELEVICKKAFSFSPHLLIENSLQGWKEIEFEIVRDQNSNCIPVCDMENFDPVGIHTGDSIVVAPCKTINHNIRKHLGELCTRLVNHLGIVGECNIQFALSPDSKDFRVIEVNARLSRSSALASKASGYPLAFVATLLSLGYRLSDIERTSGKSTITFLDFDKDYIICKVPRWDFKKFHGTSKRIGPCMASVGEVMSIGGSFEEVIQKGLRMLEQGALGFVGNSTKFDDIVKELKEPTDERIFAIAEAMEQGLSIEQINELTGIDCWFLKRLYNIVQAYHTLCSKRSMEDLSPKELWFFKKLGFSDVQIAKAIFKDSYVSGISEDKVRKVRLLKGISPFVNYINTYFNNDKNKSNYLYLTYNSKKDITNFVKFPKSVIVLGGGAYHIGSSVEFDWCCISCIKELKREGLHGIVINCNPETVSTDYDECDRLYFEEMSIERVLDIVEIERPNGIIICVGGQTPNNMALSLSQHNIKILGTSANNVDCAEDRQKFSDLIDCLNIEQPEWMEVSSTKELSSFVQKTGFPILVRSSYILSGAAMSVCYSSKNLHKCLQPEPNISQSCSVVISKFYEGWDEIEIDAVADSGRILYSALSEHIELAGKHSGDATIVFPAQHIGLIVSQKAQKVAELIAEALQITGPFNIQFLKKGEQIKVIECNLRASRTFPFISKVLGYNLISLATKAILGLSPRPLIINPEKIGVKASLYSFARIKDIDPISGVEMLSTGEVGCIENSFEEAMRLAEMSIGINFPHNIILLSADKKQSEKLLSCCRNLCLSGLKILTTLDTFEVFSKNGLDVQLVFWSKRNLKSPTIRNLISRKCIELIICIPEHSNTNSNKLGYKIRRAAVDYGIPLITDARLAITYINSAIAN